jgi:hypothetical protein
MRTDPATATAFDLIKTSTIEDLDQEEISNPRFWPDLHDNATDPLFGARTAPSTIRRHWELKVLPRSLWW